MARLITSISLLICGYATLAAVKHDIKDALQKALSHQRPAPMLTKVLVAPLMVKEATTSLSQADRLYAFEKALLHKIPTLLSSSASVPTSCNAFTEISSLLEYGICNQDEEIVALLVQHGITDDPSASTSLHCALYWYLYTTYWKTEEQFLIHSKNIFHLLFESGIDPLAKDREGKTILERAYQGWQNEVNTGYHLPGNAEIAQEIETALALQSQPS